MFYLQFLQNVVAPGAAINRDLTLVSKVIQTVANGVLFGKKELYLTPLNGFVEEYQTKILQFLEKLAVSIINSVYMIID